MKTSNLLFILIVNCFFLSSCNKDESDTGNGELTEWVPTTLPIGAKIGYIIHIRGKVNITVKA